MGERKNIPCERFVNEYDAKGNGEHFICSKDNLCRDCKEKHNALSTKEETQGDKS